VSDKPKMLPAFNITFPNGTYTDKEGNEKTRWLNVGTLFISEDKKRMAIKLDAVPTSQEFDGWLNVFQKQKSNGSTIDQAKQPSQDGIDDLGGEPIDLSDIPF
jgi:outer membrane PBP1 activator LpoA protein